MITLISLDKILALFERCYRYRVRNRIINNYIILRTYKH